MAGDTHGTTSLSPTSGGTTGGVFNSLNDGAINSVNDATLGLAGQITDAGAGAPITDAAEYLFALTAAQMPLCSLLRGEADAAALAQEPAGALHRCPECPPDQAERLPLAPAPPDLILLCR
jgi:hypothetical protein